MSDPRVLVVDDDDLIREALTALLRAAHIEVAGQVASGEEAVRRVRALNPEIVLMDLQMPGMSGIEALREIKASQASSRVIMLTVADSDELVLEALQAGADGYMLKSTPAGEFIELISGAVPGLPALSRDISGRIARRFRHGSPNAAAQNGQSGISARELEVLQLLTEAMTNREIAGELYITERTVNYHVSNLLVKLEARSRLEAATSALKVGLVDVRSEAIAG